MAMLAFLLATLLDPVQAALVLAAVLLYRGPQPILVAGAAAAAVSETVTVMAAVDYTWGELLVPRFAASLVQAAALWWLVRLMRQARPGGDAPQARGGRSLKRPRRPCDRSQRALQGHRFAPWHMRAYVRRLLRRLRIKQIQP
jgi:hypothetical protein